MAITTAQTGTGVSVRAASARPFRPNAFEGIIEIVPAERVDQVKVVNIEENTLVVTPEGGVKPIRNVVDVVNIVPNKGAAVRVFTEEALVGMAQDGEDAVETLDRITRERAQNESARFAEASTVAALDAKANTASTTELADADAFFAARAGILNSVASNGEKTLAVSKGFKTAVLSVDAADGRARIRSLEEIAGVDNVIEFDGAAPVAYVFDASRVKAAIYTAFDQVKILDQAVELEDGTTRAIGSHNELAGRTEYSYGVGVSGAAGSVAKIVITEA